MTVAGVFSQEKPYLLAWMYACLQDSGKQTYGPYAVGLFFYIKIMLKNVVIVLALSTMIMLE